VKFRIQAESLLSNIFDVSQGNKMVDYDYFVDFSYLNGGKCS